MNLKRTIFRIMFLTMITLVVSNDELANAQIIKKKGRVALKSKIKNKLKQNVEVDSSEEEQETTTNENRTVVEAASGKKDKEVNFENRIGNILFFSSAQKYGEEDKSAVSNSFKAGEYIYAIAYLSSSIKDSECGDYLDNGAANLTYYIEVDGERSTFHMNTVYMDRDEINKKDKYIIPEIVPEPSKSLTLIPRDITEKLSKISPTMHKVKIGIKIGWKELISGEFSIDCSDGQNKLAELSPQYKEAPESSDNLPQAVIINKSVENAMRKVVQNEAWAANLQILKVVITSKLDNREKYGRLSHRVMNGVIAFRKIDGTCIYRQMGFQQNYNGSEFGEMEINTTWDPVCIPCQAVK